MVETAPGRIAQPRDSGEHSVTDGTRLLAGRYRLGALIGRGGMADVHLGLDTRLDRRIAIKLLRPSLAADPRFRLLFREEAQKAARMAHPTIVRVFDAGEESVRDANGALRQVPYIVMEYVDGRLLKDVIADGPLEPREATRIIGQVLTALEYSHRALLVHRDVKPGNIMITPGGQVKVMDFGIARAVSDNSTTVAETGAVLGTAQYFSPEQARGETVDARTDLYSTGVVLFELLTGRAPFRGEHAAAVAYQHISEAAVPPSTLNPNVSPALDAVVLQALAKNKFDRFQTASDFRDDVMRAADGELPTHRSSAPVFEQALFGDADVMSDAALRQLSADDDDRVVRTQTRPPVAWIWAGVLLMVAVLAAVVIWVVGLPNQDQPMANGLSVTVPEVAGATSDAAQATLTEMDFIVTPVGVPSDEVAEGLVIRTDPPAGQQVAPQQAVQMFVSLGPTPVSVPRLDLLSEPAAIAAIQAAELQYGVSNQDYSTTVPEGVVISASPGSGTQVRKGATIDLTVSNGQVELPSVVSQPIATATATLSDTLLFSVIPVPDDGCAGGAVTAQSLPAGPQEQRAEVRLTYCAG